MTPLRPYLIRSLFEWILDNSLTPYLLVDAEQEHTVVPQQFVQDGRIVLNIRPEAIQDLQLGNTEIQFNARFGGVAMAVKIPVSSVLAIYAQENGKGMIFDDDDGEVPPSSPQSGASRDRPSKPTLRVVK